MSEEEVNKIIEVYDNVIADLKQENTQLKKEYQTELDENCKLSELWKDSQVENRQLKSVLNEIREYCEFGRKEWTTDDGFVKKVLGDVLEIIDKGFKNDE